MSVEAVHDRFTCVAEAGVAVSPVGVDGTVVSVTDPSGVAISVRI